MNLLNQLVPNPGEPFDPNLFHLDWDRLFEAVLAIVVLAFFIERALSLLFESRPFLRKAEERRAQGRGSLKAPIAFVVSGVVCLFWQFDAFSIVLLKEQTTILGAILTGAIVAGGSKASIKLFVDLMDIRSRAHRELHEGSEGNAPPANPPEPAPAGGSV